MQSNAFEILIERLEKEIGRNRKAILNMQTGRVAIDADRFRIHEEYIKYHQEMISFIKKLDGEMYAKK